MALNPDAIERSFGLKVKLNTIARTQPRTLDVASLDATVIQRRTQASRDIDIDGFGRSQGVVGSESFLRDERFRRALLNNVRARQRDSKKSGFDALLPTPAKRPVTSNYTVAYGSMREPYRSSGKIDLPFFSKVSLRAATRRLEDLGFRVEVQLIEMQ